MSELKLEGKLLAKSKLVKVTDKFSKVDFLVGVDDPKYPEEHKFQAVNKNTSILDNYQVGDKIEVHFNIKSNTYKNPDTGKTTYFTNLNAWKVVAAANAPQQEGLGGDFPGSDNGDPFA